MADVLHDQIDVLKDAARAAGSVVVDTVLDGPGGEGVLTTALNADEFVKVMAHCRPRIVYLHVGRFEPLADALTAMDIDESVDEEIANDRRVKALVKKWTFRGGEVSTLLATFMADGVLHISMRQPDWMDDFKTEAEDLATPSPMRPVRRHPERNRRSADGFGSGRPSSAITRSSMGRPGRQRRSVASWRVRCSPNSTITRSGSS